MLEIQRAASVSAPKSAYVIAVIKAAAIGISFMFVKLTLDIAQPIDALTYRFGAAFIMMALPAVFRVVSFRYRVSMIFPFLLLSALYPIGYFILQTVGLQDAASFILNESVLWYHLVGSALIISGVAGSTMAVKRKTPIYQESRS